ncbi:MAG TPA: prepilin-type N-terminal cleavage/methylation domain-containing protein [Candidatus Saccharimonadales bacterium]|nr:prepilin-type N-terminal cleavage/methylation domain-containing protein [Candidatus Saccharimonadales bacterium]
MLKRLRNQAGDTIVEVLVVLAVLGAALAIAFMIANHSLGTDRDSQEHSQALTLLQSQVEALRTLPLSTYTDGEYFCINLAATPPAAVPFTASPVNLNSYGTYPATCIQGFYHLAIHYIKAVSNAPDTFTLTAVWDSALGGKGQASLIYRLHS